MAHIEQRVFIQKIKFLYSDFFQSKSVLEIGSLNINGTIRDFFTDCEYIGIDVGEGKDVDIVCPGQDYDAPDKSFDVVCSTECFEHNPYWLETFNNMIRMCKDGGMVFFTCATTGRPEHGTTRTTPQNSPFTSQWNYYKNLEASDFTSVINFDNIFDDYIFETNPYTCDLYFYGIKKRNTKKVIDYFLFFNEKELLELRLNLLKDHVDQFIISELNYTHSGIKKDFICKNYIQQLGFTGKVTVLEIELDEDDLFPNEIDSYNANESKSDKEVKAWTRERLQRDALLEIVHEYEDDTVFICSDCDEIIDPKYVEYFSNVCRNNKNNIIKIPLIMFEGRADKRLYHNNNAVPWANSMLMCTATQLKNGGTPTQMRSNVNNSYIPNWVTEKNEVIQDCGWHFTWMGDNQRRQEKAKSFIHYANLSSVNTLSTDSVKEIISNDMSNDYEKRNYPIQLLPKIIFELPTVKNFLLPKTNQINIQKQLSDLYKNFDEQYGEWGWCSETKYNKIIDCVLETCSTQVNPVCVEIGVYGGKSLFPFALALKQLNKGKIYGIDPWSNQEALVGYDHPSHQQFWGNVNLQKMYDVCVDGINQLNVQDFVTLFKSTSDDIKNIKNISVLHIDGQHTIQLLKDIINYATNIVKGGYCFVDDIEWSEDTLKAVELMKLLEFEKIEDINGCFVYKKL